MLSANQHGEIFSCILLAQLSEGKILMVVSRVRLKSNNLLRRIRWIVNQLVFIYLSIYLFILFRIICQVVNQHKISRKRKKRSH